MSENTSPNNALSVYGQDGLEDFPVLKAFQQYIDAEQIKSRKRMVMLSIFFAALMTIMVAAFLLVLHDANAKNQSLNDRLIEYVMKERERQNIVVQPAAPVAPQPTGSENALKAMTETLVALQKQITDQQALLAKTQAPAPVVQPVVQPVPQVAPQPTPEQNAIQKKIDSDTEKLKRANAALKAEKEKLAAEKERLRQQEIELYKRRRYPEYYEKLDREAAAAEAPAPAKTPAKATPERSKPANSKTTPAATTGRTVNYFDDFDTEDAPAASKPLDDDELDNLDIPQPARAVKKPFIVPQTAPKPAAPAAKPAAEKKQPAAKSAAKPAAKSAPPAKPAAKPAAKPVAKSAEEALKPAAQEPSKSSVGSIPVEINGEAADWLVPGT